MAASGAEAEEDSMSQLYDKGHQKIVDGTVDLLNDTIEAVLVDTGLYTFAASDEFLASIASGARVATSPALSSKQVLSGGVFDAADVTVPTVSGATIEAIAIIKDTGSAATSPLLAWITSGSGLPYTPNGDDIEIVWDSGSLRIFKS
jgi:hypothetical protein